LGGVRVWIKWNHATTLPNPSLEAVDDLERVGPNTFPRFDPSDGTS
jgi:hypothetical protein